MTFVDQPKEEGEKKDCPNCEKPMIARLKTYKDNQYKPKIQWQEINETKAHYDKDGNCQWKQNKLEEENQNDSNTIPISPPVTDRYTNNSNNSSDNNEKLESIPELDKEMKSMVEGETLVLFQIRNTVKNFLKKFELDPHGGMIGQFTEIIYNKHFEANFKKGNEV